MISIVRFGLKLGKNRMGNAFIGDVAAKVKAA